MATTTATPATGNELATSGRTALGPVLVATDGTAAADAAVRAAWQLATRAQAPVIALAVLPPAPIVAADYGILLPPIETETARREALEQRVRAQLRQIVGGDHAWKFELRDGDPASRIAAAAVEHGARVIVIGLGHHDILDRVFGSETALHVLRMARVPVLAVPQSFQNLPARVAIATDFSPASRKAARAAIALLQPGLSMVYIAHVAPRLDVQPEAYAAWMSEYGSGIEPAFNAFRAELNLLAGTPVETVTLNGKPARALLDFAKAAHLDGVVTGSRGAGFVDRLLVGSTATSLIRGTHCTVLAVPQGAAFPVTDTTSSDDSHAWAHLLDDFTRRNAGRAATLEVDDPGLGAQSVHRGYPFLGAAWDHHDQRVEIMMGEQSTTRHFTRGIGEVRSIDLLRDAHGRDSVLRIAHGSGQTILTLVR